MTAPPLLARLDLPRPGIAEDAPALAAERGGEVLLGVFDGLGGAGARAVQGEDGPRSSAYYAARLARAAVADRFAAGKLRWAEVPAEFARAVGEALAARRGDTPPPPGIVRSTLLRSYPTTAALLLAAPREDGVEALAMWAGDSRCYALTPGAGLRQLSVDDNAGLPDAPMTHLLSADAPACLHAAQFRIGGPAILLVATDGCHACLGAQGQLELALLDALAEAGCGAGWSNALAGVLAPLADDDASLAAAFCGWPTIRAAARAFEGRRTALAGGG